MKTITTFSASGSHHDPNNDLISLAHNGRNALGCVQGYCQLALLEPGLSEPAKDHIQRGIENCQRVTKILHMIQEIGGPAPSRMMRQLTDLAIWLPLVALDMGANCLVKGVKLTTDIRVEGTALIARAPMQESLENLGNNGARAAVEKYSANADEARVWFQARTTDTKLEMSVADNGIGLSEALIERLLGGSLEPADIRGTGCGFRFVLETLAAHNATLDIRSTPGHGAAFVITMPLN